MDHPHFEPSTKNPALSFRHAEVFDSWVQDNGGNPGMIVRCDGRATPLDRLEKQHIVKPIYELSEDVWVDEPLGGGVNRAVVARAVLPEMMNLSANEFGDGALQTVIDLGVPVKYLPLTLQLRYMELNLVADHEEYRIARGIRFTPSFEIQTV